MGGSNNSEIGICALSEVHFGKFVREHSGLCDRTNFQKDTFESVQITFQNSRTLKTEFLEPPIYSIRTKNEAVATALKKRCCHRLTRNYNIKPLSNSRTS